MLFFYFSTLYSVQSHINRWKGKREKYNVERMVQRFCMRIQIYIYICANVEHRHCSLSLSSNISYCGTQRSTKEQGEAHLPNASHFVCLLVCLAFCWLVPFYFDIATGAWSTLKSFTNKVSSVCLIDSREFRFVCVLVFVAWLEAPARHGRLFDTPITCSFSSGGHLPQVCAFV
jgi:hypothetical protein